MQAIYQKAFEIVRNEHHQHDQWYTSVEPISNEHNDTVYRRVVRSTACQVSTNNPSRQCWECKKLKARGHKLYYTVVRAKRHGVSASRKLASEEVLVKKLRETEKKLRMKRQENVRLLASKVKEHLRQRAAVSSAHECYRRGDYRAALMQLVAFARTRRREREETPDGGPAKDEIAREMVCEINKKLVLREKNGTGRGQAYNEASRAFLQVLYCLGGRSVVSYVSKNLGLAHERGVEKWALHNKREFVRFRYGLHEDNFVMLAKLYGAIKAANGIDYPVPCMMAEDETAIIVALLWDSVYDELVGGCGQKCAAGCSSVPECEKRGCADRHECGWKTRDLTMIVGNNGDSYAKVLEFHKKHRRGKLLHAVIINPLDKRLPQLVCLLSATCNTFTTRYHLHVYSQTSHTQN